jgi:hypothetical protein
MFNLPSITLVLKEEGYLATTTDALAGAVSDKGMADYQRQVNSKAIKFIGGRESATGEVEIVIISLETVNNTSPEIRFTTVVRTADGKIRWAKIPQNAKSPFLKNNGSMGEVIGLVDFYGDDSNSIAIRIEEILNDVQTAELGREVSQTKNFDFLEARPDHELRFINGGIPAGKPKVWAILTK